MNTPAPFVVVLGTAQDGGFPQAGCQRPCCAQAWLDPDLRRDPACLAIVDPLTQQRWLLDCTPAFPAQLQRLSRLAPPSPGSPLLDGILLTHAHIGHYAGMIHLGREALATSKLPVWAMPEMRRFLSQNAPWEGLIKHNNISLRELAADTAVRLTPRLSVTPWLVPHRRDYSETVAFVIALRAGKRILYLPDIDAWRHWDISLEQALSEVDVAFLDGTFFDEQELPHRDMTSIPHPRITQTLELLKAVPESLRRRVHFIHFNHTNPVLRGETFALEQIAAAGCAVAQQGATFSLGSTSAQLGSSANQS